MNEDKNIIVPTKVGHIHELVDWENPILTSVMEPFDFDNPPMDPEQIAVDLIATMRDKKGIGLAANQIGLPYRVFAMNAHPALVCFNPRITYMEEETAVLEEGCLSFPGFIYKRSRAKSIRTRFTTPNGGVATRIFSGMTARQFQHELDHLDGKYPFEGISRMKMNAAIKESEKRGFDYSGKGFLKYALADNK